jgi:hypothetical protein
MKKVNIADHASRLVDRSTGCSPEVFGVGRVWFSIAIPESVVCRMGTDGLGGFAEPMGCSRRRRCLARLLIDAVGSLRTFTCTAAHRSVPGISNPSRYGLRKAVLRERHRAGVDTDAGGSLAKLRAEQEQCACVPERVRADPTTSGRRPHRFRSARFTVLRLSCQASLHHAQKYRLPRQWRVRVS